MITTRWTLAAGLLVALAGCGERGPDEELEPAAGASEGTPEARVPEADLTMWDVRFDDPSGEPGSFQMSEGADGWTIVTGPTGAAITWQPADLLASGPFSVAATFEVAEAPPTEGYGVFVGGHNLEDPDQRYTYFLVRGTGHYLIKRRDGATTPTLVDWTASPAVRSGGEGGAARNELEVRVEADTTRFLVNGTEVEALATEAVEPYGIAGLRVNHMLSVAVRDLRIGDGKASRMAPGTTETTPTAGTTGVDTAR